MPNQTMQPTPKAFASRRADRCMNRFSVISYLLHPAFVDKEFYLGIGKIF